ncbi:MAG TPA: hypothetical protein VK559_01715 [Ferruginibacter sp.]|nr:hypothetical protein [Ferruginibacter sp.]
MKLFSFIIRIIIVIAIIIATILAIRKEDKNAIYLHNAPPVRREPLPYGY